MVVPGLRRSLVLALTIKLAIIILAAVFVFGPSHRPRIDPGALDRQILGHTTSSNPEPMP